MKVLLSCVLFLSTLFVTAQNFTGKWQGKLVVSQSVSLRLILDVQKESDHYSCKLISVDQNNAIVNADKTVVKGDSILIDLLSIGAKLKVQLKEEKLEGNFIQMGRDFPITLTKATAEKSSPLPSSPFVTAQNFIGRWQGKLAVSQSVSLRIIFDVQKESDHYSCKLISVDQNNAIVNADKTVVKGDSILIDLLSIGAKLKVQLKEEKLEGNFIQMGRDFPITLTKATAEESQPKRPQEPKKPYPYKEKEVTFVNRMEGNTLAGTLTMPDEKSAKCAVVLVSGSGAQNRDEEVFGHKPFLVLSDFLTRNDIAVLRYDDRGVGQSDKVTKEGTTADLAYDAEAAMEYLRKECHFKKVGVIGHSEGGLIAFMLAGDQRYKKPDFVVSMAGTGVNGGEILNYQQEADMKAMGVPADMVEKAMATNKQIYNQILQSDKADDQLVASIGETIMKSLPVGAPKEFAKTQLDRLIKQLLSPWMYHLIKYDPKEVITNTKCPVLAVNGTLDSQVSATQNLTAIKSVLEKGGNRSFEVVSFDHLNHLFQEAKSGNKVEYPQIEQTMSPKVMAKISEWITHLF